MYDIFSWKFPIGRLFGVTIRVHLLFILVLLPLVLRFSLDQDAPAGTWIDACIVASITFLSVLLHEFGHVFGARSVGGEADEIMLWPLGGAAEVNYLPSTPLAHFITSACGPLVNLILCVASAIALAVCFDPSVRPVFDFFHWYPFRGSLGYNVPLWNGDLMLTQSMSIMVLSWFFYVNFFLFLFNVVLVGIPFDGGHMGRAILWPYFGFHQATMYMITSGFVISGLFFMAMFFFDRVPGLGFLAIYAFFMCRREWLILESRGEDSLFGYDFSAGYTSLEKDSPNASPPRKKLNFVQRYLQRRNARRVQREHDMQVAEETRMDELLEKIQRQGKDSLTDEETRFLKRVSDRYRNRH